MQIFDGEIRFGIHSGQQNTTLAEYSRLWRRTEELGYDWASCFDHFLPIHSSPEGPCFDGLTVLSALAAQTSRLRCGILVVSVTYRNPAILAKIGTTIDQVSGGRLELGMGAGWYELEHEEYGIPFPSPAHRIRMLAEAVRIVKSLWTEHRTTIHGRYFEVTDALSEPKPAQQPRPPIWIGGSGEKLTLRVVASEADGWNTFYGPVAEYERKLGILAGHCREVGRDPQDIRKSLAIPMLLRETEAEIEQGLRELAESGHSDAERIRQGGLVGTPEQCIERIRPFLRLGVGDFLYLARAPYDYQTLELVARQVAPAVKAEASVAR